MAQAEKSYHPSFFPKDFITGDLAHLLPISQVNFWRRSVGKHGEDSFKWYRLVVG